jgi:anti-sigma factor RsiW
MTVDAERPSENDLHAYADGQLAQPQREAIDHWLASHPEDQALVDEWQAQSAAIRATFAGYARTTAADARLFGTARRSSFLPSWKNLAAGVALFAAGTAAGHYLPFADEVELQRVAAQMELPDEAHAAYLVYASEVRHPVEVAAAEEAHLAAWLGKRLSHANLKVPDLTRFGFHLVGGRLVPVEGQAGALFMYEDQKGQRLTMLVGRNASNRETSFRFAGDGLVETFYWIDNGFGYAVTGEVSRDLLRQVAEETYSQFPT